MFKRQRSNNERRKIDRSKEIVPMFHGTDSVRKPEDFDIDKSNKHGDFGAAGYFSPRYAIANAFARKKGRGIVNWYLFHQKKARKEASFNDTESDLEWINTYLRFIEGDYEGDEDFIIGDMVDSTASFVLREYRHMANELGVKLYELDDETKLEMLDKLHTKDFDQQMAIKTEKGLKYIELVDYHEARDMDTSDPYVDPVDAAAGVVYLMVERYGISEEDAMIRFLKSRTFHMVIDDQNMARMSPERILAIYEQEG